MEGEFTLAAVNLVSDVLEQLDSEVGSENNDLHEDTQR